MKEYEIEIVGAARAQELRLSPCSLAPSEQVGRIERHEAALVRLHTQTSSHLLNTGTDDRSNTGTDVRTLNRFC